MGSRAQVRIIPRYGVGDLYLYTHWGAESLHCVVASALDHGSDRLDDEAYLAAIIFRHMIAADGGDLKATTGLGIDTYGHGDADFTITVDMIEERMIDQSGEPATFNEFIEKWAPVRNGGAR